MLLSAFMRGVAAISVLLPAAALAQETSVPEIVVTAPLEGARIESLQGATVLSREDIVESLNGGLGDTLDAQPGIASTFFGAGASRPIIRGLGDDRVRVLENGIGAIDASTASPDHAVTADGLDATRIEVLRGAAALAFGGNAIGGVVNVIDESIPTRPPADGFSAGGLLAYSSVDEGRQGAANVALDAGPLTLRGSVAARETDNYAIPGFADVSGTGPEGEAPNSWTSFRAYALGASAIRTWGFAGVAVKRTEDDYGLREGGRIELEQNRIEARGDARISAGPFDRLDFAVQHADYEHTEFEPDGSAGTRFTNQGYEARLEAHHSSDRHQGATGLQINESDFAAEGDEAFITPTSTRDVGVFAIERWDNQSWGLEGGARYETRDIDNQGGGAIDFQTISASAGVFVRPATNWFAAATLARTERAPTAIELFADGPHLATETYEVGDPTLDAEIATSFELSTRYDSGPVRFELNLFRIGFDDYVALVERGDVFWIDEATETSGFAPDETDPSIPAGAEILPVFAFTQQDATFTGGEVSAAARVFEAAGVRYSASAALDIVRASFDGGGHPPRIPPQTLTLGLEGENAHFSGRVEWVGVSEQARLAAFETLTEGYQMVNARLAVRPYGESGPLTLRLDARNLADEEARAHSSFLKDVLPLPGRSLRFTLATAF